MLAFHGFGGTWKDFAAPVPVLGDRFTIHAFDIRFHGAGTFPGAGAGSGVEGSATASCESLNPSSPWHRWHLKSDRMKRYLLVHADTPRKRRLEHDVWLRPRCIGPERDVVAGDLEHHELQAHLHMGLHDKVIRLPWAWSFARRAAERMHVHPLDRGHIVLVPGTAEAMLEHLGPGTTAPPV